MRLLFFSRGRGHGHAIPDMAIADQILAKRPHFDIRFASYSTGADTFRSANRELIDMHLPESNSFVSTLFSCSNVIIAESPSLIVAHEEYAAVAASVLHEVPSVYISAWLPQSGTIAAESLGYAKSVIVLEDPGIFPVPLELRVQPSYSGPIIRPVSFTSKDRLRLRHEMGWAEECFYMLVVPGGGTSEGQGSIADVVISTFMRLDIPRKKLIWISSKDHAFLSNRFSGFPDVEVSPFVDPIERLLSAADVIITKGTRGITYDAAAVGVPSISLSLGQNSIDDLIVPRIHSNLALNANAVEPNMLAQCIMNSIKPPYTPLRVPVKHALTHVADAIIAAAESPSPAV